MVAKAALSGLALAFVFSSVGAAETPKETPTEIGVESQIRIVGSSTVYPFSTAVAERFGKTTKYKTPIVESTGTGGGMKLFCSGSGQKYPPITNASRRIKASEIALCAGNGVGDIVEVKVGYDGIVIANSRRTDQMNLTRTDIFTALAKEIPDGQGGWIANPNKTWNDVANHLPATTIEVIGPPPTSGTRDAFVELAMEAGCLTYEGVAELKKVDKSLFKAKCHSIREDGLFVVAGENDNLIVQKLNANTNAFGIFGFSFLDQNGDLVQGSMVEGTEPLYEAISDGSYPISRSLFFYVKADSAETQASIRAFLVEFTNERTWGPEGYLADKGLISMPEDERKQWHKKINGLEKLSAIN